MLNGVDSLVTCAASLLFPLGAPVKLRTTCVRGWGGSVHRQGCGCWSATLPTSSSSSELMVEKSGLGSCDIEDPREGGRGSSSSMSSEVEYFSSSLSESITISRISFGDSRWAREISRSIDENCSATTGWNGKLWTDKAVEENAAAPYLTTVTQLCVTKIT